MTALCIVGGLLGLLFTLALCKAAKRGDEMMRIINQSGLTKEEE